MELRLSEIFSAARPDESNSGWLKDGGMLVLNPEELSERGVSEGEGSIGNRTAFKYSFPMGFSSAWYYRIC